MKCKHRVLDKCEKDGYPCIFSEECFEPEEPKLITNADRIRSMSDEDLAEALHDELPQCPPNGECAAYFGNCRDCWYAWLKQPADTGTDTNVGNKGGRMTNENNT